MLQKWKFTNYYKNIFTNKRSRRYTNTLTHSTQCTAHCIWNNGKSIKGIRKIACKGKRAEDEDKGKKEKVRDKRTEEEYKGQRAKDREKGQSEKDSERRTERKGKRTEAGDIQDINDQNGGR